MAEQELTASIRTLRKRVAEADRVLTEIERLSSDRVENAARLANKLSTLERATSALEESTGVAPRLREVIKTERSQLDGALREARARFGAQLEGELAKLGMRLTGQYPELKAGMFSLELELEKGEVRVWLGPKQEPLGTSPASAPKVSKFLERTSASLGSNVDDDRYLGWLMETYASQKAKVAGSKAVSVTALLPGMAAAVQSTKFSDDPRREHYRSYGRADFSFDLYRHRAALKAAGVQLRVATRAETRSRRDFLWIPEDESGHGSTYSRIEIEERT